ncbi:protein Wnt-5a-like isoform X1 [Parus major]|uniref:protein Wnt-5a-like isoform X1 n=1 Tax=Parus major TaxID=9157 RepID=UPI00077143C9|nr:protein Wnt-5a-like isoform X1 [Parus major]
MKSPSFLCAVTASFPTLCPISAFALCSLVPSLVLLQARSSRDKRWHHAIHAISAASFASAVTCACSHGELHKHGCDHKIRGVSPEGGRRNGQQGEGFQWSGCSDNLFYGIDFSQAFVDSPERSCGVSSSRMLINLHNNESGRKGSPMLPEESASFCLSWPSTVLITLSWLLLVWRGVPASPPLFCAVSFSSHPTYDLGNNSLCSSLKGFPAPPAPLQ